VRLHGHSQVIIGSEVIVTRDNDVCCAIDGGCEYRQILGISTIGWNGADLDPDRTQSELLFQPNGLIDIKTLLQARAIPNRMKFVE
jgi:hypothetical protein